MRSEIEWLDDALAAKDVVMAMTHYRVKDNFLTATNGRISAGHPCKVAGEFLVPGAEMKDIMKRLPDEPKVKLEDNKVILRSGRFHGSIQTLPMDQWTYPELEKTKWKPLPSWFIAAIRQLRPFVSDNAVHRWSLGIAIDDGWCYASNNIALAGCRVGGVEQVKVLLPAWAADFVLERAEGISHWVVAPNYIAFKWDNGAWMRTVVIDDKFPERAAEMIRKVPESLSQEIYPEYREAVCRISELSEDYVSIYKDKVQGRTQKSLVSEELRSEVPEGRDASHWGARFLAPVMAAASHWQPSLYPAPVPFLNSKKEPNKLKGFIAGRMV